MLLEHFAGDKREKVELTLVVLSFFRLPLHPAVELFLVVKEEEFVFENLRAANFSLLFFSISLGNITQVLSVLIDLHISLLLFLCEVHAHLFQMVLKKLLVGLLSSEIDSLAETNQIDRLLVGGGQTLGTVHISSSIESSL